MEEDSEERGEERVGMGCRRQTAADLLISGAKAEEQGMT